MKICQSCGKEFVKHRAKCRTTKSCEICRKEFEAFPYVLRAGYGKFCSLECKAISQRGVKKVKNNRSCLVCQKYFHTSVSQDRKYCSSDCYHKSTIGRSNYNKGLPMSEEQKLKVSTSRRGKLLGESNHSWKGGITPVNHLIRESSAMIEWRKAVFKKDDYTCVWCKKRGYKIHADHIKPFAWYPKLRFEISNGQILCKECHQWKTKMDLKVWQYKIS